MSRFDVYKNRANSWKFSPYVVDLQANSIDYVGTRIVIPLTYLDRFQISSKINPLFPVFTILDHEFFLHTSELAAVPSKTLNQPVASLQHAQHRITCALDFLFNGY